jgi:hypothetical protein
MYPYIAGVLQPYLKSKLAGIRVATEVPATRPTRLVTLSVVPAGSSDKPEFLSWRRVIVHCWDDTGEADAGRLAETVRSLLLSSRYERIGIRKVVIVGEPGRYDDPDDGKPRFQLTADFMLRANI